MNRDGQFLTFLKNVRFVFVSDEIDRFGIKTIVLIDRFGIKTTNIEYLIQK